MQQVEPHSFAFSQKESEDARREIEAFGTTFVSMWSLMLRCLQIQLNVKLPSVINGDSFEKARVIKSGSYGTVWEGKLATDRVCVKVLKDATFHDMVFECVAVNIFASLEQRFHGILKGHGDTHVSVLCWRNDAGTLMFGPLMPFIEHIGERWLEFTIHKRDQFCFRFRTLINSLNKCNVFHCDLNYGNVLIREVDSELFPCLIDFGLSCIGGVRIRNRECNDNTMLEKHFTRAALDSHYEHVREKQKLLCAPLSSLTDENEWLRPPAPVSSQYDSSCSSIDIQMDNLNLDK